ncbi:MAG: AAA family ATPase [Alphaproteobacteria bacterium HGW-Alphaproteobacteria-18]|nr:MAG: AAA family ATPase [Alphaproteobacteria bacterium HGW-Alphaproteobacteria-18]
MTSATPDTVYAAPAEWVARGAGAQGNLFLTGRAGTGKTTLLRKFLAEAGDKAVVLAPTGVAAMNAGGQTIHSFFKLPPRLVEPQDIRRLPNARVVRAVETVVIDEISMVRADMLDAIDRSLKLNRGSKRPFGGARMILSGDLHQLPPVVSAQERPILADRYGGSYFFNAPVFREAEFSLLALKHVFRQAEPRFLALLGALRSGRVTPSDETILQGLVSGRSAADASDTHVVLTPNNANAFRINQSRLASLKGERKIFPATVQGQFDEKSYPTELDLELRVGARVMMIRNDPEGRWVNGTLAHVAGFGARSVIVEIAGRAYEIDPVAWEKYRYDFEMDTKKVKREVVGTFKQMPLRLAYAVTIHKAQGLTLDKVFIDFDSGMFAHGQAYVAFSRARTLEGLEISRALRPRDIVLDREAFAFGELEKIDETPAYLLAKFRKDEGVLV